MLKQGVPTPTRARDCAKRGQTITVGGYQDRVFFDSGMYQAVNFTTLDIYALEAEQIIAVSEKLIERHMQLGPKSPLQNIMIADLNAKVSRARQRHDEGMKYKRAMESALIERDAHLGNPDKGVRPMLETIIAILRDHSTDSTDTHWL